MFAATPPAATPPGGTLPAATSSAAWSATPRVSSVVNRMTCSPIQASAILAAMSGSAMLPLPRAVASTASNSRWKPISCPKLETPRSTPSMPSATRQPSPGEPATLPAGVRASSKNTSLNSAVPVICTIGRILMPGWRTGTSRQDRPRWRSAPGSVRASRKHQSAMCAIEVHIFCPSMCHSPSRNDARVRRPARSEPAPGSEYPWHHSSVPAAIPGRKRAFCSAVPNISSVGPTSCSPMWPTRPGASARAYSSWKMTCIDQGRLRPPFSSGQPRPIQPSAPRRCSQAMRSAMNSCWRPEPPLPTR